MTEDERALLLMVAKWCLRLESGAATALELENHAGLKRLRELIERVEAPEAH